MSPVPKRRRCDAPARFRGSLFFLARHERPGCGTLNGSYAVFDLIDYTIPPLVAVE